MKRVCVRTRRAWLLAQDGQTNLAARLMMRRHFRTCPGCRDFAGAAADIIARVPHPDFGPPSDRVARALHMRAAAELDRARETERGEENRVRARQSFLGAFAGAAAALLLSLVSPGIEWDSSRRAALDGSPDAPVATENSAGGTAPTFNPASLDDNLDDLEERLDCLRALIDDFKWNSLEGGDSCADT